MNKQGPQYLIFINKDSKQEGGFIDSQSDIQL